MKKWLRSLFGVDRIDEFIKQTELTKVNVDTAMAIKIAELECTNRSLQGIIKKLRKEIKQLKEKQ